MANKQKGVSEADWLKARKKLLVREKKFLRLQDAMSADRRSLSWLLDFKTPPSGPRARSPNLLRAVHSYSLDASLSLHRRSLQRCR